GIVGSIDRYAFWLSVVIGIAGWAYISGLRVPAAFYTVFRKQLRRSFLLCTAAAGALVVSVISDGVLTALRLPGTELSAEFLIPIFSMVIEIACAGDFDHHRSEEHTSELQSRVDLVCRLLLEKKKKQQQDQYDTIVRCQC